MPATNFFLKVEGLDTLNAILSRISGGFQPYMVEAMQRNLTMVLNNAKAIGPGSFKNRTGNLRRSIQVIGTPTATRGVVGTDQTYAIYVEQGTGAHVIMPNKKKALFWPGAAHPVRLVNHPGSKPYPYMEPALKEAAPHILQTYIDMFQALARGGVVG